MGVSAQLVCIALCFTLAVEIVSSQSNGTVTSSDANNTGGGTAADPASKGKSGLKCYKCSSFLKEQYCDNPSEEKTPIEECAAGEDMCRKVEQQITVEGDEQTRTYRECAKSGDLGSCSERTGTQNFKSWYCQCKGNLCNGATHSVVSFTLLASMVTLFFSLKNRI